MENWPKFKNPHKLPGGTEARWVPGIHRTDFCFIPLLLIFLQRFRSEHGAVQPGVQMGFVNRQNGFRAVKHGLHFRFPRPANAGNFAQPAGVHLAHLAPLLIVHLGGQNAGYILRHPIIYKFILRIPGRRRSSYDLERFVIFDHIFGGQQLVGKIVKRVLGNIFVRKITARKNARIRSRGEMLRTLSVAGV